jgi:hypothetical protein
MIAKIRRGSNLYGALAYNQLKVAKETGQVLFTSKMIETNDGHYSVAQLIQSFEPYLTANRNTEKPVLHISINPDPKDQVSDERFRAMAEKYMQEMGYREQPFVVFKHTDIDRTHIHIVSVCIDEEGRKISDKFEKRRSMNICREMESKYGLIAALPKEHKQNDNIFQPVDYQKGNIKSQIASVVRYLPKSYLFQTLGEYNALLSLFNITTELVGGEQHGKMQQGLLYFPTKNNGERAGHPFKSSLFGKSAGLPALNLHFAKSRDLLKENSAKLHLKSIVTNALQLNNEEISFIKYLIKQGINVIVRRNNTGRIYGMTFIDHNSKTVRNGSRLGTEFSANSFNDYWNTSTQKQKNEPVDLNFCSSQLKHEKDLPEIVPHHLFNFLKADEQVDIFSETLFGFLPKAEGEDYEEQDFANRMRKKRKGKTGR